MQDEDIQSQVDELEHILFSSEYIVAVTDGLQSLGLQDYYLAGGCITQTVWNYLHGYALDKHIKDYDVVYYDPDESYVAEDKVIQTARKVFAGLPIDVEVRNQARVHLWYEERFGKPSPQYTSAAAGINSWPVTACCIGVRLDQGKLRVYAPYGLRDLFGLIARPNKVLAPEEVYNAKLARWTKAWPKLQVIPWTERPGATSSIRRAS